MKVRLLRHTHQSFPRRLRQRLMAVMAPAQTTTEEIARLHAELGEAFGQAARKIITRMPATRRPVLIGLSGQTVCHLPSRRPYQTVTLQLGDGSKVAARAQVPTIAEFRQGDIAAGGQGAPLVPWTDWVLFHHPSKHRLIQNIGGIGNFTWLPAGGGPEKVVAFDTGPGNMLIDALVTRVTDGRSTYDRDGRRAARGRVLEDVLARWMRHPFFKQPPPRTTGRELFGLLFLNAQWPLLRRASRDPNDWIATATALTASSIADAFARFINPAYRSIKRAKGALLPVEMIVAGGGARNRTLRAMLVEALPGVVIRTMDEVGIPVEAKEAVSFAILAAACMDRVPGHLPQVTGAVEPAIMGHWCDPLP